MTQNREIPKAEHRTGEDFEWVNHWAASGAARRPTRSQAIERDHRAIEARVQQIESDPTAIESLSAGDRSAIVGDSSAIAPDHYGCAPGQLDRDLADIAAARDALIAQDQPPTFRVPPALMGRPVDARRRNRDSVPI